MARKPKVTIAEGVTEEPAEVKSPVVGRFVGVKHSFYHPFQRVPIPVGGSGVMLELDSWLQSQIDAGFIVKL